MTLFKENKLIQAIVNYIKIRLALLQLNLAEQVAQIIAKAIACLFILSMAVGVMLFLSLALAQWLNTLWDSTSLGYLAVGGIYFILLILAWLFWKSGRLKNIFESMLIKRMHHKTNHERKP